ncbi:putative autotransporter adhesin-like protein [Winogradskyella wandonensis]|uniref:Putative autotransporter adhesin-like protein n=1 Tax=Winogradskyella wandonensis TaxID=1442586 RepID=A0A4V2PU71_9FLAO|nr:head GIN domain-containing protein [Winogradskyella wandonensis]TCK69081.1 putative autotransporter adhesin-like protein [Winogradskyella wandonensis]
MKQLKLIFSFILLGALTTSNAQWWGGKGVKGNGDVTTITRTTSDYDGIKCAGFMDFKLVEGEEGKITIKGESNLLEYIVTEVKNGNLIIKVQKGKNLKPSNNTPLLITVPYRDITTVSLSGSGDVWNEGTINADEFSASVAGSGDLILNINSENTKASVSGSGDLTLKGRSKNLKANVAGSGDFHGFKLESVNVDASVAGSGDISINCSGELKARVAGSGDIEYRGNPTSTDTKVVGSGSIEN